MVRTLRAGDLLTDLRGRWRPVAALARSSVPRRARLRRPRGARACGWSARPGRAASPSRPPRTRRSPGGSAARPSGRRASGSLKHGALARRAQRGYHGTPLRLRPLDLALGRARASASPSWSRRGRPARRANSWVEVRVRVAAGRRDVRWMVLGRWASGDKHVRRTSVPGQSDALGRVDVDTWKAAGAGGLVLPAPGAADAPRRRAPSASPSVSLRRRGRLPAARRRRPPSRRPASARGIVLDVPRYSQMVHRGDFPQYGGGGEAWCSPTSTAMVLGYYGRLPAASSYRGSGPAADPWVDEVARRPTTRLRGTGNWPFNTAYAASRGLAAFVTRLRSLPRPSRSSRPASRVIASVSFSSGRARPAPRSPRPPATCW